ncbi:uncharacterized protein LOC131651105 [Vicia villosa]|uniref:uncharacterized protein LOC131651105 n=1 Tax=Vicia villosa TaxID=3911 RepID=UPI00273BC7B5|nr:uncharacterized protein LOC131651105 [Vicia villosa]
MKDGFNWRCAPGGFSVKSVYDKLCAYGESNSGFTTECLSSLRFMWKSGTLGNIQVFGWRLIHSRLQTRDELFKRHVISGQHNHGCPLCLHHNENHTQLFLYCQVTKEVWLSIFAWVRLAGFYSSVSVYDHLSWFVSIMPGGIKKSRKTLIWLSVVRAIWLIRNDILFNGRLQGSREIVVVAKSLAWEWLCAVKHGQCPLTHDEWNLCPLLALS